VYDGPTPGSERALLINAGRYYGDGLLVESERSVQYDAQPGAALPPSGGEGTYLVYLDVWKRHVTAVEDPGLREVALSGVDSGTRSQVAWQIRMERLGDRSVDLGGVDAGRFGPSWRPEGRASTGALDAQARGVLGNQLYRVEIHRGGKAGQASFKWSRDNGTVVTRVLTSSRPREATVDWGGVPTPVWQVTLTVESTGRDGTSRFAPNQWVELSSEELVLQRKPGLFGRVRRVGGNGIDVEVPQASGPLSSTDPDVNPLVGRITTVRRWDSAWNPDDPGVTLQDAGGGRVLLERELTVKFARVDADGNDCLYQPGDYWLIPTRTASGLEQWKEGETQPPAGEKHAYAPLALVKLQADGTVLDPAVDLRDLRDVFPTLRSLADGVGGIVQGSGVKDSLPRWQSTGGSMLVGSNVSDDGSQVAVAVPLKVGAAADSTPVARFTSSGIEAMSAADLAATAPTSQGVKHFVEWAVPAGTVIAYASETVPDGWLECNGFQYDGSTGGKYARLFSAIRKTFGGGNGSPSSFNVPDLRGVFIRGWSNGSSRDPDRSSRSGGDHVGSYQSDQYASHGHGFSGSGGSTDGANAGHSHEQYGYQANFLRLNPNWGPLFGNCEYGLASIQTGGMSQNHSHSFNISGSIGLNGGSESRPKNVNLMYVIKY